MFVSFNEYWSRRKWKTKYFCIDLRIFGIFSLHIFYFELRRPRTGSISTRKVSDEICGGDFLIVEMIFNFQIETKSNWQPTQFYFCWRLSFRAVWRIRRATTHSILVETIFFFFFSIISSSIWSGQSLCTWIDFIISSRQFKFEIRFFVREKIQKICRWNL